MTPQPSHGRVWRLAGPIMLSNISVPLLGAVDTAVVGHLPGAQNIGAVAVGAMIFSFVYWGFGFLRMGTTGLTAQALGAGDGDEVRAIFVRAMLLAVALGLLLLVVQRPLAWLALDLITAGGAVNDLADVYYSIRIWGAPAALANYVFLGWFLGVHNTRAALVLQVAMNGANILLDLWFVLGLGLGVEGVALATLIAEVGAIGVGMWLVRGNLRRVSGQWRRALILDPERLRRVFLINRDIFIRTLCLISSFALFTAMGARLGDLTLAVNAVLLNFQTFAAYGLDAFAHATEALAGSAAGARDREKFSAAVRATNLWAVIFSVGFALVYAVFGGTLIDIITDIPEVRQEARAYLPWVIALPVVSVWSFQLDGIYLAATRSADMRNAMMISAAVYTGAVFALLPLLGNHGLWLALMVLMVARTATLGWRYRRLVESIGG